MGVLFKYQSTAGHLPDRAVTSIIVLDTSSVNTLLAGSGFVTAGFGDDSFLSLHLAEWW